MSTDCESTSAAAPSVERTADAGIRIVTEERDTGLACKCRGRFRGRWSATPNLSTATTTEPEFLTAAASPVTVATTTPVVSGND